MRDLPKHREATFLRHAAYPLQKAGRSPQGGENGVPPSQGGENRVPPSQGGEDGGPPRKGGKVGGVWSFPPLRRGDTGGVLRVPLRCPRFGIQAIENRSRALTWRSGRWQGPVRAALFLRGNPA